MVKILFYFTWLNSYVEGKTEKDAVLPILIEKIYQKNKLPSPSIKIRNARGRGNLFLSNKIWGIIKDLLTVHPDISKVIVCVDSECTEFNKMKEAVKRVENEIKVSLKNIAVTYCVVVHALESWLASDNGAIAKRYEINSQKVYKDISIKIQKECKAKEFLKKVLKTKYNKDFDYVRDDEKIAMKINDIDRIAKINNSFLEFKNIVLDP